MFRCSVGKCPVLLKCSPPERKNRRSAARPADAITFVNSYKTLIRRICSFPDFIPRFVKGCVGKTGCLSKPCSGRCGFPRSEGFAVPGKAFEDTPGIFSMSSPQGRSPVSMADIPILCQSDKAAHPGLSPSPVRFLLRISRGTKRTVPGSDRTPMCFSSTKIIYWDSGKVNRQSDFFPVFGPVCSGNLLLPGEKTGKNGADALIKEKIRAKVPGGIGLWKNYYSISADI